MTTIFIKNHDPKPSDPIKAAVLAQKKADPERQARRMAKKNAKRASLKMQSVASESGTKGKVSLKPNQKKGGAKAPIARKKSHSAKKRLSLTSLALLALSMIALILVPDVSANNEILNFGPIMCAADEHGHLQERAARQLSKDWPSLKSLTGVQLFSLDPVNEPEVWIALDLEDVKEMEEMMDFDTSASSADRSLSTRKATTSILPSDLHSSGFPLISRDIQSQFSPRDLWLKMLPKRLGWYTYSKRFTFRVDWSANFPIKVQANLHTPHSMLAAGKARWQANEHEFDENRRTEEQDLIDAIYWPCPRVYVHLQVDVEALPIPPRRPKFVSKQSGSSSLWDMFLNLSEWYIEPLTNPSNSASMDGSPTSKIVSPVPVHLILEPVYLGFIPHTSLSLFMILIPLLLLSSYVLTPIVKNKITQILTEDDDPTLQKRKEQ
ncbi:uncharacterized protein FA14DRAFT_168953 [Meira miltonrushii]|uniref:Uncharacterized protein n=1 Tax=Meira miltonrushii TaxID=1280837 RepID=A0A316V347_9BASI|nr:uncharacterized protein FA14DRAFT_168953 [Meira miltonrushii]PWN31950.1 hypothetical protein FA14DRAFT_168953 [Meira miltonrushii]